MTNGHEAVDQAEDRSNHASKSKQFVHMRDYKIHNHSPLKTYAASLMAGHMRTTATQLERVLACEKTRRELGSSEHAHKSLLLIGKRSLHEVRRCMKCHQLKSHYDWKQLLNGCKEM